MAVEEGKRYAKGTCAFNRLSDEPTRCAYPAPQPSGYMAAIIDLFNLSDSDTNHVGMDGVPVGRHTRDLEAGARALRLDWNHVTLRRYRSYEAVWVQKQLREYRARIEASKRK